MEEVVNWRRALLNSNTTIVRGRERERERGREGGREGGSKDVLFIQEALQDIKIKLSATIDEINRQSGCPWTPRNPQTGQAVDCQVTNILDLWKLVSLTPIPLCLGMRPKSFVLAS